MENWQKKFILENQHYLISNAICTTLLIAKLGQEGVLSESDVAELNNGVIDDFTRSMRVYQILMSKSNGYKILLDALREDNQTEAVSILEGTKKPSTFKQPPQSSHNNRSLLEIVSIDEVSDEENVDSGLQSESDTLPFIKRDASPSGNWSWKHILTFTIAITSLVAFIVAVFLLIEAYMHSNPAPNPTTNSTPSPSSTLHTDSFSSTTSTTITTSLPVPLTNLKLVGLLLGPVGDKGVLELVKDMFGPDTCVSTDSPTTGPENLVSYEIVGASSTPGKECDSSKELIVVDIPLLEGDADEIKYSEVMSYLETICQTNGSNNCSTIFLLSVVSSLYKAFQDGRWDPNRVKTLVDSVRSDEKIGALNSKTFIHGPAPREEDYWARQFEKITVIPLLTSPEIFLSPVSTPNFSESMSQAVSWSYFRKQLFSS